MFVLALSNVSNGRSMMNHAE